MTISTATRGPATGLCSSGAGAVPRCRFGEPPSRLLRLPDGRSVEAPRPADSDGAFCRPAAAHGRLLSCLPGTASIMARSATGPSHTPLLH